MQELIDILIEYYSPETIDPENDTVSWEALEAAAEHCGDTLFLFLVRELSGCARPSEALRRLSTAMGQIQDVTCGIFNHWDKMY